jgi:hypothetical protein
MDLPSVEVGDTVRFYIPAVDPSRIDHRNIFCGIISAEGQIPLAARSKAWAHGFCLDGITGSNPPGYMDVCVL